ncbi:MAG TPA: NAD(P)/FAD-dependent oxidoreductase, partial [Lapillicoccus sp.]|nr:NAD(P)/FAD-dependent oxidoreductase [Lapillicoccus sp.]
VGDLMSLEHLPGVAEVAMQTGFYAARRIKHEVEQRGREQKPFRYHDLGSAAYISRGRAVVSVKRFHASGFVGWLMWLGIHLAFLTSFRNRLSAILTWTIAFSRESRRERAFTLMQTIPGQDVYQPPPEGDDLPEETRP